MSRVTYGAVALTLASLAACDRVTPKAPGTQPMATGDVQAAALASYVKPGDQDQYYLFYSGGHSGQVFVAGVPSMRHIATIPVFAPYPGTGYGFDEESKAMLGGFTWGDVHHPALSKTAGDYDGRWLFVNDNANNRIARIDLRDLKTKQILGPIPNTMGNHGSSMVTDNTEYALVATRFSVPIRERVRAAGGLCHQVQGRGHRHQGGSATGDHDDRLADHDAALQLGPRRDRQGTSVELGLLDLVQHASAPPGSSRSTATQKDRDYVAVVNWKAAERRPRRAGRDGSTPAASRSWIRPRCRA